MPDIYIPNATAFDVPSRRPRSSRGRFALTDLILGMCGCDPERNCGLGDAVLPLEPVGCPAIPGSGPIGLITPATVVSTMNSSGDTSQRQVKFYNELTSVDNYQLNATPAGTTNVDLTTAGVIQNEVDWIWTTANILTPGASLKLTLQKAVVTAGPTVTYTTLYSWTIQPRNPAGLQFLAGRMFLAEASQTFQGLSTMLSLKTTGGATVVGSEYLRIIVDTPIAGNLQAWTPSLIRPPLKAAGV